MQFFLQSECSFFNLVVQLFKELYFKRWRMCKTKGIQQDSIHPLLIFLWSHFTSFLGRIWRMYTWSPWQQCQNVTRRNKILITWESESVTWGFCLTSTQVIFTIFSTAWTELAVVLLQILHSLSRVCFQAGHNLFSFSNTAQVSPRHCLWKLAISGLQQSNNWVNDYRRKWQSL